MIDLTHTLSAAISVCPGDPKFNQKPVMTLGKHVANVHAISLGSHTGSHIDAPFYFFANRRTVDMLVAPAVVVDVQGKMARERITWDKDLASHPASRQE